MLPKYIHILEIMQSIEGPWAFIYFDDAENKLFFGRDKLGRRSLLLDM